MLKITSQRAEGIATLKLEGALREAWIEETRREVAAACGSGTRVALDLSDLSFADESGIRLLRGLINQGIHIMACSGYLAASLGLEDV